MMVLLESISMPPKSLFGMRPPRGTNPYRACVTGSLFYTSTYRWHSVVKTMRASLALFPKQRGELASIRTVNVRCSASRVLIGST